MRATYSVKFPSVIDVSDTAPEATVSGASLQATSTTQANGMRLSEISLRIVFLPYGFEVIHELMEGRNLVEICMDIAVYKLGSASNVRELSGGEGIKVFLSCEDGINLCRGDGLNNPLFEVFDAVKLGEEASGTLNGF